MLVLRRRLNDTTYAGRDLDPKRVVETCDWCIRITRIVDSFDKPRVAADITYASGEVEQVQFTPQYPTVEVEGCTVKLVSIRTLVRADQSQEPFVNLGFEAPPEVTIVRDNARTTE